MAPEPAPRPTLGRTVLVYVNDAWHAAVVSEVPGDDAPRPVRLASGPDVPGIAVTPFPQRRDFDLGSLPTIVWVPRQPDVHNADGQKWCWPPRV